jgi:gliding-associated putative ABC transporter substrate-binding component GldG
MKRRTLIIRLAVIFIFLILLNLISYRLFFRFDFTADQRFTLSKATRNILNGLTDKVIISAYFSEDLPTQLIKSRADFEDLLTEYKNLSNGNVSFTFSNPNENEAGEKLAQTEGIQPVMVNVSERDQVKQLRAYMGVTINVNGKKEIIPMIRPGESAEYNLTTSIKKLISNNKQKVAFLQGHGERRSSELGQVVEQLSIAYTVEDFQLTDTTDIDQPYKTLVMIDPTDSITPAHLSKLENYLQRGGSILLAYGNVYGDLRSGVIQKTPDIGLQTWLGKFGVSLNDQFTIDVQCRTVAIQQQRGPFVYNRPVKFPYFPIIKNFADHPVTKGLEAVFFPFPSSINAEKKNPAIEFIPLAYSSKKSGTVNAPAVINFDKEWQPTDFAKGPLIIAAALQGPLTGTGNSKMIVVANGKFAVNTEPGQEELNADNVNFASNAIDWLSDDTGLIELRTKSVSYRPLDPLDDPAKEIVKYLNVGLPVLIIVLVGIVRRGNNLRKRRRLIQSTY